MRLSSVVLNVFSFLIYPAIIFTTILYLYPAVQNCHFPAPQSKSDTCILPNDSNGIRAPTAVAPFRLLALGDPQLEGDTSLPDPNAPKFPSLEELRSRLASSSLDGVTNILGPALRECATKDIPRVFKSYRKRLDLLGNDFYLRHIYRLTRWWTQPTHVVVLGDLLGSQWISDVEFERRSDRFWNRVFAGAERIPDSVTSSKLVEVLGADDIWNKRLINVAGNHDIGYAGDINEGRMERFERAFGPANWAMTFQLPTNDSLTPPSLNLVMLNSMNLDKPVWNHVLHNETHQFLDQQYVSASQLSSQDAVVLLTHIPLHKEEGICVDAPYFSYFRPEHGAGIREQNHLRQESSQDILRGLFGTHTGVVLNGHDHEGCDTFHSRPTSQDSDENQWNAVHFSNSTADPHDGIREVTVRSMMGAYNGNAGLLSAWFDTEVGEWRFEYSTCVLGVQHIWWAVHVFDLIVGILGLFAGVAWALETNSLKRGVDVDRVKKDN